MGCGTAGLGVMESVLLVMRFRLHVSAIGTTPANPLYNLSISIGNLLAVLTFVVGTAFSVLLLRWYACGLPKPMTERET